MTTLAQRLQDLAVSIGTDIKTLRTYATGTPTGDLSTLATTTKTSLIAALNEVRQLALDAAAEGGAVINDAATNSTDAWSGQKIADEITTAINGLATGAPAALNSIDELAAALGDDANVITTILTSLGNRLRFDAAQTLTAPQKVQANANLGSLSLVDAGNPDQDLAAVYAAAKV